ncbi:MAG: type II toxin-antitoxin system RelE/ParE family toxin [Microbacterium sp.]
MTGRIHYTPEAQQQLNALDDWITEKTSPDVAQRFVSAILDFIDGILDFPRAGRARDDVRPGMRTTTFRKRTLIAYVVDESSDELVVNILGVFHGGQDWEAALRDE